MFSITLILSRFFTLGLVTWATGQGVHGEGGGGEGGE